MVAGGLAREAALRASSVPASASASVDLRLLHDHKVTGAHPRSTPSQRFNWKSRYYSPDLFPSSRKSFVLPTTHSSKLITEEIQIAVQ